VIMPDIVWVSI